MYKSPLVKSIVISLVLVGIIFPMAIPANAASAKQEENTKFCREKTYIPVVKTVKWVVTAYSSSPDETDDTPEIAASGQKVFDGMVANNGLPFGTKVRMPELFGDKILIVADRMHERKGTSHGDVWMSSKEEAKHFGARWNIKVEIL